MLRIKPEINLQILVDKYGFKKDKCKDNTFIFSRLDEYFDIRIEENNIIYLICDSYAGLNVSYFENNEYIDCIQDLINDGLVEKVEE